MFRMMKDIESGFDWLTIIDKEITFSTAAASLKETDDWQMECFDCLLLWME